LRGGGRWTISDRESFRMPDFPPDADEREDREARKATSTDYLKK
jgi:hypothetical protein